MHGAELMQAMLDERPELEFMGAGGPHMKKVGGEKILDWVDDAAVMGVWEVLKHYKWFKARFNEMLEQIKANQPEILILIDYPGFNLRMAKAVKEQCPNTKIVYYVSPQVWAWNRGRIPKIAAVVDKMLCILPFEEKLYENVGLDTTFVGHPIVDELTEKKLDIEREASLIGLFPGSREREVSRLFPVMVEAARRLHLRNQDWKFEAPAATGPMAELMRKIADDANLPEEFELTITDGKSDVLMQRATCGVIASGTATVEAAFLGLPYCLCYKVALPTYLLGKMLVKIEHIGLINILAGEEVVEEFIQGDADPCHLERALERFMTDDEHREAVQARELEVAKMLGEPGAHIRAAEQALACLK